MAPRAHASVGRSVLRILIGQPATPTPTASATTFVAPRNGLTDSDGGGEQERREGLEAEPVLDGPVVEPRELRPDARRLEAVLQQTRYVSQLPAPADLERYREMIPDAPERLLAAGEREQQHRHEIENRAAALDEEAMPKFFDGQRRGHWISAVATLGYEGLMALAILEGYALEGIVGAAFGIAAVVWAFRRDTDGGDPPPPVADAAPAQPAPPVE
jgi:uncharacterized membrane protein